MLDSTLLSRESNVIDIDYVPIVRGITAESDTDNVYRAGVKVYNDLVPDVILKINILRP